MKRFFILLLLICCSLISASANSAPVIEDGSSGSDVIVIDDDCPIEVMNEKLTFTASESKLTAEYTFYNPEDYIVTSRLVFPLGAYPFSETTSDDVQITVNQKPVEIQTRYTFKHHYEDLDLPNDLSKLHDTYKQDDFFSPELSVTRHVYHISNLISGVYLDGILNSAMAVFEIPKNDRDTLFCLSEINYLSEQDDRVQIGTYIQNDHTLEVVMIGEPIEDLKWTLYKEGNLTELAEGEITLIHSEFMTFQEYSMRNYPPDSHILEHDWYNALIDYLKDSTYDYPVFQTYSEPILSIPLMKWYDYNMTINPHESIINCVSAPLVPTVYHDTNPPVYSYSYFLSPAKHFQSFQNLNITIETEDYLISTNLPYEFAKTDEGYALSLTQLPDQDLWFQLCADENPNQKMNTNYFSFSLIATLFFLGVPIVLIYLFIMFFVKSKIQR